MLSKLLRRLNLSYRLFVLIGIFAIGFLVYGAWSFKTLDTLKVNGPLYASIVASKDVVADALPPPLFIIESQLVALQMAAAAGNPARLAALEARLAALRAEHAARSQHWISSGLDAGTLALIDASATPARAFYDAAFGGLLPALRSGDGPAAARAVAAMDASYEAHRLAVDRLVARAHAMAKSTETQAAARIERDRNILLLTLIAALGIAVLAAVQIKRSITTPLAEALALARRVASGDMREQPHARASDEPGMLLAALDSMRRSLAATMAERSASELSLRRAKELNERLIDSASVMVVGLDRDGQVLIFNEAACKVTGYARADVLGRVWRELALVDPADRGHWPAAGDWDGVALASDDAITTIDGDQRRIAWKNTVLGEEGGAIALMAFGSDVTEQHRAYADTLAAREQAEAATRSKSEFLATMSHEIRTPMNAIIGMTRLALKTELSARQRNYLDKAEHAAHGLLGIINDILDFSKIEAGKLRFEERPILLRTSLDQLAGLTMYRAQEKGLELLFDVAPDVPQELVGDPLRVGQVLLNLVNNAIKFTEHGEIVVGIRIAERRERDVVLRFDVRDTGIGILPEQADRLFASFVQADASTTRTHGGTGLGLSISRKLVEMMDGTLWLDSEYGKGSCFSFTARLGLHSGPSQAPALAAPLGVMRVLVVDDNAAACEIMQAILESLRMRVKTCPSAETGIAELEEAERQGDPYQLLMMDWIMPGMDGLAAIRAIRANPVISDLLEIVMVTAYSRDDLLANAEDLERLGVLDKPVTPSSVLDAITDGASAAGLRPSPQAPQPGTRARRQRLRGAHVLLVEDNEVNQELAVEILEDMGLTVSVAGNGQIALDMIAVTRYDAVLMDCQMPVMDGYEATRRIRQQPQLAGLPVLAMTANAMTGDRERCLEAGMNDHISKPIDQDLLALLLTQWIGEHPGSASQRPALDSRMLERMRRAGIDPMLALERVGGDDLAYRKNAAALVPSQAALAAKLRQVLAEGNPELARRLAHNLHGLAARAGAVALSAVAERVAVAIASDIGVDAALASLEPVLAETVDALDAYLKD